LDHGWFFSTVENMYCNTGLSKHQQRLACKELMDYGIIKVKYQGLPKKRYFRFDPAAFNKLYSEFQSYLFQPCGDTGPAVLDEPDDVVEFVASF
jgi:hypothetical protein